MKHLPGILMLLLMAGLLFQPSVRSEASVQKLPVITGLQSGDLVVRSGKGIISSIFTGTSIHDKTYSHAGLVLLTTSGPFVLHIIGSQNPSNNDMKFEPLASFVSSESNSGYAVYRYAFAKGQAGNIERALLRLKETKMKFDDSFDLESDNRQYCTELIYKYWKSLLHIELPKTSTVKGDYISVDNLYLNSFSSCITKHTY